MDESLNMESKLQSAAAFVEGGIQDACDDSCSICLEAFCENDPSTVTSCKHEFHLQCILEWCQRSSQCPMCWQPISLKDPTSQELFEGVEHERNIRSNQTRNATIFHHPAIGDFELQHLPDGELEERIIQHLAAAAAMGRARHISRREGQRGRSAAQGRPEFLVFATHPNASSIGSVSSAPRAESEPSAAAAASPSSVNADVEEESSRQVSVVNAPQVDPVTPLSSGSSIANANRPVISNSRVSAGQTTPVGQDRAGPSDLQSFSESLKSRLNAVSMRYKDSITKNTRGWKERLFSRNTSVADIGSEVRREVSAGIASVSRMMERLDTRDGRRTTNSSGQQSSTDYSENQPNNGTVPESNSGIYMPLFFFICFKRFDAEDPNYTKAQFDAEGCDNIFVSLTAPSNYRGSSMFNVKAGETIHELWDVNTMEASKYKEAVLATVDFVGTSPVNPLPCGCSVLRPSSAKKKP